MSSIEVEVAGSTTRRRTNLRDDVNIEDLIPTLATLVGDASPAAGTWMALTAGGVRLPGNSTLSESGVVDGDTLFVARAVTATDPDLVSEMPQISDRRTPSERGSQLLPERLSAARRIVDCCRAFLGLASTRETLSGGAYVRARAIWRWGDHRRRLAWLIAQPQLKRTVTIGIVTKSETHSGAALATAIAGAIGSARSDRVVLVDGDPSTRGVSRLGGGGRPTIGDLVGGSGSIDARFGAPGPTVVVCDADPEAEPTLDTYRTLLERLRPQAGLVVIDCGRVGNTHLDDLCEQLVLVIDGPLDNATARRLGSRATVLAVSPAAPSRQLVDRSLSTALASVTLIDELAAFEITAVLAHSWSAMNATRPQARGAGGLVAATRTPRAVI